MPIQPDNIIAGHQVQNIPLQSPPFYERFRRVEIIVSTRKAPTSIGDQRRDGL